MTFDWGFGAPFSIGWWWVDSDNRVYRFGEWYGWDGKNPNRGIRITDAEIAEGILRREKEMGIHKYPITRIAGPDCFRKKANYMGGGQGPSTADEFKSFCESSYARDLFGHDVTLKLIPGDADRERKMRQFRNRMRVPDEPSFMPMLVVYDTCTEFIRTIPSISLDEDNIEVVEDGQEDHVYDESAHICMARPIGADLTSLGQSAAVFESAQKVRRLDSASRAAAQELFRIKQGLVDNESNVDERILRDPTLDPRSVGLNELEFDDLESGAEDILKLIPQLRGLF
jgi:hypothetical protein